MAKKSEKKKAKRVVVSFIPKDCPKCSKSLCVRHLGVWGYWCIDCMFWWGVIDDFPKEKSK